MEDERPELLPDGEVAKALKRLWARIRAAPPWKTIGILNVVFGMLGVMGSCITIALMIGAYAETREADAALDLIMGVSAGVMGTQEEHEAEMAESRRRAETFLTVGMIAGGLRLTNAAFLAISGVLLLVRGPRGRRTALVALVLIPVEFVVTALPCGPPEWCHVFISPVRALRPYGRPLHLARGVVALAWVVVYPWLGIRALRKMRATEEHAAG